MNTWSELIKLTGDSDFIIEKVKLKSGIRIEGEFELSELFQLTQDDLVFVMAFVKCHGSIKAMEKFFGVSYPTIKSRLNAISQKLKMVDIESSEVLDKKEILNKLEKGELSVDEATNLLVRQ